MAKVKICGLKTLADVAAVNRNQPDYIGFVFAHTKRFVTDEQALLMKKELDKKIQAVGVFVNEPIEHIASLCERHIIDVIQLHGDEDDAYIRALKKVTHCPIIKAVRVQSAEQVAAALTDEVDYMLFDTYKKGVYGGSGERLPLAVLQESLQQKKVQPYFLAGGLSPDNIEEVLGELDCYCVDVSTGVETDGCKDETKIKDFIDKVRRL